MEKGGGEGDEKVFIVGMEMDNCANPSFLLLLMVITIIFNPVLDGETVIIGGIIGGIITD